MFKYVVKKFLVYLLVASMLFSFKSMVIFAEELKEAVVDIDMEEVDVDINKTFIGKDGGLKKDEMVEDVVEPISINEDKDIEDEENDSFTNDVFASSNNRAITIDDFGKTLSDGSYYLESDVRADINKSDNSFISIKGIVEIDLNGYTLSGFRGSPVIMVNDGELTIKNGRVIAYDCYAISLTERSSKIKVESGEYYTSSRYSSSVFPKCISVTYDTNDMVIEEGYFSDLQFEAVYTQYNFEYIKQSVVTVAEGSEVIKERKVCGKDELTGKDLVANYIITKVNIDEEETTEEEKTTKEETTVEETVEATTEATAEETTKETVETTAETKTEETTEETIQETTAAETEVIVITEDDFGKTLKSGKYILDRDVTSAEGSIFTDGDVDIDLKGWTLTGNKSWYSTIEVSGGTLTIHNGEVVSKNGGYAICVCEGAKLVVEDGYYYSTYNYESVYGGDKGDIVLNGGSFVKLPDRYTIQEGLVVNNNKVAHNGRSYNYTVGENNETENATENEIVSRAITEDDFGNTLTTGVYTLEKNINSNKGSIYAEGDVVIDLNGYTLTGSKYWYSVIEVKSGTLTIKNGEIFSQNGGYAICVCEDAKVIIEDGYYFATYNYESVYGGDKSEIEIKSGCFSKLPSEYTLQDGSNLTSKWSIHNYKLYFNTIE